MNVQKILCERCACEVYQSKTKNIDFGAGREPYTDWSVLLSLKPGGDAYVLVPRGRYKDGTQIGRAGRLAAKRFGFSVRYSVRTNGTLFWRRA